MIREMFSDDELLSILVDTVEDSIFIVVNGKIEFVNNELCRLSGYSPDELIDRHFLDFVAPEERDKVKNYYLKRMSGADCPSKYDSVALGSSGDRIPVRVSISPIRHHGGDAEMVICRDIRKIREFEEKYREVTDNFRDALEKSPDGVIIADPNGKHLYVNRRLSEILGYTREECLQLSINDTTPDRDLDQYKKMYRDRLKGESVPNVYERTVLHKDGGEIPVEMRTTTTVWNGEKCVLAFLTDITERRRMEQALIESDRRMKTLLKNLPGIVYRCLNGPAWTMEFLSQGCSGLTGYSASDLENNRILSYSEVIHPDDRARVWNEVQTALESSEKFDLEYRIITKDDSVKWVRELGRCVRCDSDGRPEILEGFITDISYRKRAEQEQRILYEINRTFSSTEDPVQLYRKLHQLITQLIPAENIYIAIINSEKQVIEFPYFVDDHDPRPGPVALGDSHGLTELVLRRGEPVFVNREQFQQLEREGEIRLTGTLPQEWIGVPLRASGKIIGVLALQSYSSKIRFPSNALHLLEVVSNDIANVIVQKRAQEKLEKSEMFNSSIIESSIDCIKILDLDGNLRFISRADRVYWKLKT